MVEYDGEISRKHRGGLVNFKLRWGTTSFDLIVRVSPGLSSRSIRSCTAIILQFGHSGMVAREVVASHYACK